MNDIGKRIFVLVGCLLCSSLSSAAQETPPKIGNFALPTSQQPAPLISFGQRMIGKDVVQLNFFASDRLGPSQHYVDSAVVLDYGNADNFTTTFFVPYAFSYRDDDNRSSGFEDIGIQCEYAFLSKTTHQYSDQATLVANLSFPTGSATQQPPTGFGAVGVFSGLTMSRAYTDWNLFSSAGIQVPTEYRGTKFGNSFLYQCGLGRNIAYITNKMVFSWWLELDGTYTERNKLQGELDPDSGGNIIYLTPSLWLSFQKFYLQFGVGWAISQHLFGVQNKYTYSVTGILVWTF